MPLGPCRHLSVDQVLLDGGRQRLALGDRETKVLRPLRLLLEYRHFSGATPGAIVGSDLKENLHAHGEPPLLIAGRRAFHNDRCGKLETDPVRRSPLLWPAWAF
jgi:hypothetical protein